MVPSLLKRRNAQARSSPHVKQRNAAAKSWPFQARPRPALTGCNHLIREGATLIRDIGDIMECLARPMGAGVPPAQDWKTGRLAPGTPEAIDQCRDAILSGLGPETTDIDEVIAWCDAPTATVLAALLELELAGRVTRHHGNQISPCHGQVNATGPSSRTLTNVEIDTICGLRQEGRP